MGEAETLPSGETRRGELNRLDFVAGGKLLLCLASRLYFFH